MSDPRLPDSIEELLAGYVLDDLSAEEIQEVEQLLIDEPRLNLEIQRLQETFDLLPYALPEVELPPQLRQTLLETTLSIRSPKRPSWSRMLWGAITLLALSLSLDNYRLRQELRLAQDRKNAIDVLQQADTRVFFLIGTEKAKTASGSIAIAPQHRKAVMIFQNLPTLSQGQIYRLWAIIDDRKIACADFRVTQDGKVFQEFSVPVDSCAAHQSTLAVTLEPLPSSPQPVGPAVMLEKASDWTSDKKMDAYTISGQERS